MNLTKRRKSDGGLFQASTTGYFRYFTPKDKLKWNDPARVKVPIQRTGADQLTGGEAHRNRLAEAGFEVPQASQRPKKNSTCLCVAYVIHEKYENSIDPRPNRTADKAEGGGGPQKTGANSH